MATIRWCPIYPFYGTFNNPCHQVPSLGNRIRQLPGLWNLNDTFLVDDVRHLTIKNFPISPLPLWECLTVIICDRSKGIPMLPSSNCSHRSKRIEFDHLSTSHFHFAPRPASRCIWSHVSPPAKLAPSFHYYKFLPAIRCWMGRGQIEGIFSGQIATFLGLPSPSIGLPLGPWIQTTLSLRHWEQRGYGKSHAPCEILPSSPIVSFNVNIAGKS